ncbi:hypothetical protein [Thermus sp.]|uniref:hypothetical protein n=1 Tax=Thermus sp. TaxID=275 RepID=UPI003D0B850E
MRPFWFLLTFLALALAQGTVRDFKATAVGDALGWESPGFALWLVLPEKERVELALYSPGLDPEDYRSALRGKEELGDERYDGGRGEVRATFRLLQGGSLLQEMAFGVEPHRWVAFFSGELSPGAYLFESHLSGLAKNAFVLRITASRYQVLLDPKAVVVDVSTASSTTIRLLPDQRGRVWVEPLAVYSEEPLDVYFYDEDGPEELRARVRYEGGSVEERQVSGDREWVRYEKKPGLAFFGFAQPPTAKQYSNTVAYRLEACASWESGFLRAVPPGEAKARVVDEAGNPLNLPVEAQGRFFRPLLPPGANLLRVEGRGAVVPREGGAEVGCPGGEAVFVVRLPSPPAPKEGEVRVRLRLVLPTGEAPGVAQVGLGGEPERVEGEKIFRLPPGRYPLRVTAEGARVEAPKEVEVGPGEAKEVEVRLYPQVDLALSPKEVYLRVGEEAEVALEGSTPYRGLLSGELLLELPEGLEAQTATRATGPLTAGRPLALKVRFQALKEGRYPLLARLAPYGLTAEGSAVAVRPATFALKKEALTPEVEPGGVARFRVTVVNEGDEEGRTLLLDRFLGKEERREVFLGPKEGRSYELAFPVPPEAQGVLVNRAGLSTGEEAEASLRVVRPKAHLERDLPHRVYLPGEEVELRLLVENRGEAPMRYTLEDACPDWLAPLAPPRFEGYLKPGERALHAYRARVLLGPEARGACVARLRTPLEEVRAEVDLARRPLELVKEAEPARVLEGAEGVFRLRVRNPADHPVEVELKDIPGQGLAMEPWSERVRLGPGEERSFTLAFRAEAVGEAANQLVAFLGETPAAFPAQAKVAVLPLLAPERLSVVRLPFRVEGQGDLLLLGFRLPQGAEYRPGSARLDGVPVEEPRLLGDALVFRLPFRPEGTLTLALLHRDPLPPLQAPSLTLVRLDRELPLQGKLSLKDYERAKPLPKDRKGLILEPQDGAIVQGEAVSLKVEAPLGPIRVAVNGFEVPSRLLGEAQYDEGRKVQRLAYYGVPLAPGRNVVEVEGPGFYDKVEVFRPGPAKALVLEPVRLVADGRTPLEFRLKAVDDLGLPTGFGLATLEADPEPIAPDASLQETGYQVLLKDGVGTLLLRPLLAPREVRVRARFNELEREFRLFAGGREEPFWLAQGSVGVAYRPGEPPKAFGLARGYGELPLGEGLLQVAVDTTGGLSRTPDPGLFPITGSGEEAKRPLASHDPLAFRYAASGLTLSYERGGLAPGLGEATALRLSTRGDLRLEAFLGLLPRGQVREEIVPDGTAFYRLAQSPAPGSLRLTLQEGARLKVLSPGVDYTYDFRTGEIALARPLFPLTPDFAPVRLIAEYAPLASPRDLLAAGATLTQEAGPWRFSLGGYALAASRALSGYAFGAAVGYEEGANRARLEATYAGKWRFGLSAGLKEGPWEARGDLLAEEGGVQGSFRAAYDLGPGVLALEHTTPARTGLVYEQKIAQGFRFGLGAGFAWAEGRPYLLGRALYAEGRARFGLSHAYLLSGAQETRLDLLWPLGEALDAEGSLAYLFGSGLQGAFGLRQRLGSANLSLSYQLPTASGEGNRARFGLEAPFPLTQELSANFSLFALYALSEGRADLGGGVGLRYAREGLVATFGVEAALAPKLLLRGGAAGSLDPENTLALDFTLGLLPRAEGRFGLAYALRASTLSLLTYHRYASADGVLEGQLALAYAPSPLFSLRPALGYRYPFPDPAGATYALGLYATLFPLDPFGLGGGAAYTFQPATGARHLAFSVEGTLRLSPLWLSLGYQFGESLFAPEGVYLRLDVFGGSR